MADGQIPAYVARPAKAGQHPVILVVQEIFGVHEHIKDMCRRFAKLGYYAIAPELFARQGDVSKMSDIGAILSEVVSKVPDAQVCADLDAAVAFARASGHADTSRVGLVGYCWGGRTAWIYTSGLTKASMPEYRPSTGTLISAPKSTGSSGLMGDFMPSSKP